MTQGVAYSRQGIGRRSDVQLRRFQGRRARLLRQRHRLAGTLHPAGQAHRRKTGACWPKPRSGRAPTPTCWWTRTGSAAIRPSCEVYGYASWSAAQGHRDAAQSGRPTARVRARRRGRRLNCPPARRRNTCSRVPGPRMPPSQHSEPRPASRCGSHSSRSRSWCWTRFLQTSACQDSLNILHTSGSFHSPRKGRGCRLALAASSFTNRSADWIPLQFAALFHRD